MTIEDLIEEIKAEVNFHNCVRFSETHLVADLVVKVENMLEDAKDDLSNPMMASIKTQR